MLAVSRIVILTTRVIISVNFKKKKKRLKHKLCTLLDYVELTKARHKSCLCEQNYYLLLMKN